MQLQRQKRQQVYQQQQQYLNSNNALNTNSQVIKGRKMRSNANSPRHLQGSQQQIYSASSLYDQHQEKRNDQVLRELLQKNQGLLSMRLKVPIYDSYALSLVYTPGVGQSCLEIQKDQYNKYIFTNLGNSVAIVTDGTGYNNAGQANWKKEATLPSLECNSALYKVSCNIDAYPILIDDQHIQSEDDYIETLDALAGSVGVIELYNIKTNRISQIVRKIEQNRKGYGIITPIQRKLIQGQVGVRKLYKIFPENIAISVIMRAMLDVNYHGIIKKDLIDHLFFNLRVNGLDSWDVLQMAHQICIEWMFQRGTANTDRQKQQIINEFKNFVLEGPQAYSNKQIISEKYQTIQDKSLALHQKFKGVVEVDMKFKPRQLQKFAEMVKEQNLEYIELQILQQPQLYKQLSSKTNLCAIITNGTAILGFGDIGATAGLPVMEGKSAIFKQLGGVDVVPLCFQEKDPKKFIQLVKRVAPMFSAINLEDIKAPQCFEIENTLKAELDIPVFHDDQHGTAIVCAAAVLNSLKLMELQASEVKVIINGGGAAGLSITQLLIDIGVQNLIVCDTKGAIFSERPYNMNPQKNELAALTNKKREEGTLEKIIEGAHIFVGVSAGGALKPEWVKKMNPKNLILAMANPYPEIMPDEAKKAGAFIVGTGRSDFKNQVNNSLAFPGIFRGALDVQARNITQEMKIAAANAIANLIPDNELNPDYIIPSSLDTRVPIQVSKAVALKAMEQGISRVLKTEKDIEENIKNYIVERDLVLRQY